MTYDPKVIEGKWQERWAREGLFRVDESRPKSEKYYSLETFPYPSAAGLHVGHPEGYTAEDINARYQRMRGRSVLYTMGWDAFGLPTENYAIKVGQKPSEVAAENIANFKRQVQMFGFSYDWNREINTSSPEYYKWTQWIFLQLYKKGLAYRAKAPVNWCDSCKTVLANEQVVDGVCERCDQAVSQREMEQWFFKITDYADDLLHGLETVDWPESSKEAQKNWIGKSEGSLLSFTIIASGAKQSSIEVFTTRPDTLFGATYLVLAPEHTLIEQFKLQIANWAEVEAYRAQAQKRSFVDRQNLTREKTGVKLKGIKAINPGSGEEMSVWIADYVIASYGTGAIMGVPAHDQRDWEFATKFELPIRIVICPNYPEKTCPVLTEAYNGPGHLVDSGKFNGLPEEEAKKKITDAVGGKFLTTYRMRDWLVSRQRYWGAPIPIIWCEHCGAVPVPEKDLPVLLPDDVDFRPTGEPPLASSKSFQKVKCPQCRADARRDFETMDTFVDSSWYYFRYCSPQFDEGPFDTEKVKYWMPIDLYVIGAEHSTKHLIYARFMAKVLMDDREYEPFQKLRHIGLIMGADGQKMSKSRGNVVNPDEVVDQYGADAMRLFEMFLGPLEDAKPWSTDSIRGVRRFLDKVWRLCLEMPERGEMPAITHLLHKTIKIVTEDLETMSYNTAIARFMEFTNAWQTTGGISRASKETFLKLLHPFAPHITEELWSQLGPQDSIMREPWPTYDPTLAVEATLKIPVQVNGKVRATLEVAPDITEDAIKPIVLAEPNVARWLVGKSPTIRFVPGKIVSITTS